MANKANFSTDEWTKVLQSVMEGGFLGFGGVRVSEAEKATLAEISGALGLKA